MIGDGRSGEAAAAAGDHRAGGAARRCPIDSPDASKVAPRDAAARSRRDRRARGIGSSASSTATSTRSTPSRRRSGPISSRSCAPRPRSPASTRCACSIRRRPWPGTWHRSARGRSPARGRRRRRQGRHGRAARRADRPHASVSARSRARAGTRSTASRRTALAGPRRGRARDRDGRDRRRAAAAPPACTASRRPPRSCRSRCSSCSTAISWARPRPCWRASTARSTPTATAISRTTRTSSSRPLAEPFAAFGASAETVAAEGVGTGRRRARGRRRQRRPDRRPLRHRSPRPPPRRTGSRWVPPTAARRCPSVNVDAHDRRLQTASTPCRCPGRALTPVGGDAAAAGAAGRSDRSPTPRAPRPTSSAGTEEGDFRAIDGTSLVSGKAVLLPRDGAPIAAARRRGRRRGRQRARALRRRRRAGRAPSGWTIASSCRSRCCPGDQGATAAATLLTGGA